MNLTSEMNEENFVEFKLFLTAPSGSQKCLTLEITGNKSSIYYDEVFVVLLFFLIEKQANNLLF